MNPMQSAYQMGRDAFLNGQRKQEAFCRIRKMMHLPERMRMSRQWRRGWRDAVRGKAE